MDVEKLQQEEDLAGGGGCCEGEDVKKDELLSTFAVLLMNMVFSTILFSSIEGKHVVSSG